MPDLPGIPIQGLSSEEIAMLKKLITRIAKSLFRSAPSIGYQTRVYPTIGEVIVVHDSLDFSSLATGEQLSRMSAFWQGDEFDNLSATRSCSTAVLRQCSTFDINPANGIPMMCDTLDVMGIPLGGAT